MSSDSDEEVQDLAAIRDKILSLPPSERMQVSAWDDDNEGIQLHRNPQGYLHIF